jgi:hypothetical protein
MNVTEYHGSVVGRQGIIIKTKLMVLGPDTALLSLIP